MGPLGIFMTDRFTPSVPLLARIYALHVSALPLVLVSLLGLHLYLIRYLGIHTRAESPPGDSVPPSLLANRRLRRLAGRGTRRAGARPAARTPGTPPSRGWR